LPRSMRCGCWPSRARVLSACRSLLPSGSSRRRQRRRCAIVPRCACAWRRLLAARDGHALRSQAGRTPTENHPQMFKGSITALVTPLRDGAFDEKAFRALVDWQITEGTHGLVPVGTTGESPTLSHEEHRRVVKVCIEAAAGRVPVIAGAGSNNTTEAIDLARFAEKAGADGLLIVTPYYNKPNQEGLYQHYKAINDAIGIPIVIYNIPPRSVIDMSVET